jgi:hypothetical protein
MEDFAKLYIEDGAQGDIGGGPVFTFHGKRIPYCGCASTSASISLTSLTDMLRYMDLFQVFDRDAGEMPLLLLDGHHSRMDLEVSEHNNVNIGLPYSTHIW